MTRLTFLVTMVYLLNIIQDTGSLSFSSFIILQQDAYDKIDQSSPLERQKFMYNLVIDICEKNPEFESFEECANYY